MSAFHIYKANDRRILRSTVSWSEYPRGSYYGCQTVVATCEDTGLATELTTVLNEKEQRLWDEHKPDDGWIFTFGLDDTENKDNYVKIRGTYAEARKVMFLMYSNNWGFQYENVNEAKIEDYMHCTELVETQPGVYVHI